jgi:hypothetical protein
MDDPSEVSGIFTTQEEESTFASQSQRRGGRSIGDNASDIVSGYPALDDESLIVSEDGGHSAAASGIFTEQQSRATSGVGSAAGKSNGSKKSPANGALGGTNSYDVENSTTSGGNTNDIIGGYGTLGTLNTSSPPDGKKSNSWLTDAFQLFGLPLGTMPTAKSTPDKATTNLTPRQEDDAMQSDLGDSVSALTPDKPVYTASAAMAAYTERTASGNNAAAGSNGPEPTKVCGIRTSRLIIASGALVIVALIVVIVAVVLSNNDDDPPPSLIPDADFNNFLTRTPTASPSTEDDVVVNPNCFPDDDSATFIVSQETVDCAWLRSRESVFIEVLCDTRSDIATTCRTTCQNCFTEQPSFAPSTHEPSTSPTTPSPTIFLISQFPTRTTVPPSAGPTLGKYLLFDFYT